MEREEEVPLKMIQSWSPQLLTDATVNVGTRDKHLREAGDVPLLDQAEKLYFKLKFIIQPFDNTALFSN